MLVAVFLSSDFLKYIYKILCFGYRLSDFQKICTTTSKKWVAYSSSSPSNVSVPREDCNRIFKNKRVYKAKYKVEFMINSQ